jgi:hypothetical protein
MDGNQMTNKELALILLRRFIALEVEREAMVTVLNGCKDVETQKPLEWLPLVLRNRDKGTFEMIFF